MKQELGLILVQLGANPFGLFVGLLASVALVVVCAIVISAIRDLRVQRAWARRSAQHFQRRPDQRWD